MFYSSSELFVLQERIGVIMAKITRVMIGVAMFAAIVFLYSFICHPSIDIGVWFSVSVLAIIVNWHVSKMET